MKILLEAPIGMASGLGRDGIGLCRALLERGHSVALDPIRVKAPLPTDVAHLLSIDNTIPGPYDLRISHVAVIDAQLSASNAEMATRNILWTMWEWEAIPVDWQEPFRERTKHFDTFVAYDRGAMSALRPYCNAETKVVVQGGYESEDWLASRAPEKNPFVFGMLGNISARKNPLAAITAFRTFRDAHPGVPACLRIKSLTPFLGTLDPFVDEEYDIAEHCAVWGHGDMEKFYRSIHCLVAPSTGEGKNLPALEAATHGVPLILSDIPGHKQWAHALDSVLWVRGTPKPMHVFDTTLLGTHVDPALLTEAMTTMHTDYTYLRMRARANIPQVVNSMDWFKVLERLGNVLDIPWL